MKKKLVSALLGISMCVSGLIIPVSAAEDVSETVTFDGYTTADESSYDLPTGWSESNGNSNRPDQDHAFWYGTNVPYMGTQLYAQKGMYGKAADDTAYEIRTIYRGADKAYNSRWYDTRYAMAKNLEGRKYIKISYEMAVDIARSNRFMQIQFYNPTTKKWGSTAHLVDIVPGTNSGECIFEIGGAAVDIAVPDNKWMKFDYVIDAVDKTVDVYVNGKLAKANMDLGLNADFTPGRLNALIFGQYAVALNGNNGTYEAHTYLDNVSYLLTDTKPTVDAYTAPDTIDFQNYEGTVLPQGYDYNAKAYSSFVTNSATYQKQYTYSALRGKDAQDISWRISAPETKDATDQWQAYRWNTNLNVSKNNTGYIKFSTEFCMEGAAMTRGISVKTTHDNGWADNDIIKISKENGEQVVTVGGGTDMSSNVRTNYSGEKITLDLPMSVVMKIDVVINRNEKENNKFDLYINGERVAENVKMPASYISSIQQIILYAQQNWNAETVWYGENKAKNCFIESETYFDNMDIGKYYSYPEVDEYTLPTVTRMKDYDTTVNPIDGATDFGHWVQLRGYDSKYYYYAENVTMPADNATRAYEATFGKLSDNKTTIITDNKILEVKNGEAKVYGNDVDAAIPTDREFKLSFLFDIVSKTFNAYVDDEAIAVDVKFETNNAGKPITEFSSIENTVTALDRAANVSVHPVASGAFTKLPENTKFYSVAADGDNVTATVLSSKLTGTPIIAVYGADGVLKNAVFGDAGTVTAAKASGETAKFMLWNSSNFKPLMNVKNID